MINKRTGRLLVLGFGMSGVAATRLLLGKGWVVTVADERADLTESLHAAGFNPASVHIVQDTTKIAADDVDAAIVSPGIPCNHPWLIDLRAKDIPIIPEFELGLSFLPEAQVIAVTGSNGKSSLIKWIADALTASGRKAVPAGNYGLPPCAIAASEDAPEVIVLELSSFQLEQAVSFKADISVLLNLSPNHLDRHASYEEYKKAKARLFACAKPGDLVFVHAPALDAVKAALPETCVPRLFGEGIQWDAGTSEGAVFLSGVKKVDLSGTWWGAFPQAVNASVGVAILDYLGMDADAIRGAAESFEPLPHRLETIAVHNGVTFIDDSKASTLSALQASVKSGDAKKHLIAGGILKETDVSFVKEILGENCAFVYCIGTVAEELADAWGDVVPCENCGDLETAVTKVFTQVKPGEVVLLSPGCSSFDQFASYAQRGEKFKELVQKCINRNRGEEINMQGVRI